MIKRFPLQYMVFPSLVIFALFFACGSGGDEDRPAEAGSEDHAQAPSDETEHAHTNRLIHETSPYLLQHAHNPVDWYPWGDEAFEKAVAENKPIFLSIGYSACHWCHVMERESFENEEVAAIMNENFVCIKVDREERPDVDGVYMAAVQIMNRRGGWPLTVIMTPDKRPFFGGTYFPPEDRGGRSGLKSIMRQISTFWNEEAHKPESQARMDRLVQQLRQSSGGPKGGGNAASITLDLAVSRLKQSFDPVWGGFGTAPKFPPSAKLALLLRWYFRTGDAEALKIATHTLDRMKEGGLYDQLGGGFHRYSTDEKWLIPHFEKMLYDNALLVPVYLDASIITGNKEYVRIVRETLDYLLRDMTHPDGGILSTEDADSEGEEGKFYAWERDDLIELLGESEGTFVADYFDVSVTGNFEHGKSALRTRDPLERIAGNHSLSTEKAREILARGAKRLFDEREKRVRPGKDDKILTSWNGLAITAFARAGRKLEEPRYVEAATRIASFIDEKLVVNGRLLHTWKSGEAKVDAFLDDYAYLVQGLIDLYEATWELEYLEKAIHWNGKMVEYFVDEANGGFFYTGTENEELLTRAKNHFDGATPSGNSIAAMNLARLQRLTGQSELRQIAEKLFNCFTQPLNRNPGGSAAMLNALDFHFGEPREIAVVGPGDDSETKQFLSELARSYSPDAVTAYLDLSLDPKQALAVMPFLEGKEGVAEASVYICRDYVCDAPIYDVASLRLALENAASTQ